MLRQLLVGAAASVCNIAIHALVMVTVIKVTRIADELATRHQTLRLIAVMIAVSAMACQFALFRLALPGGISTAVMTGNLTNTVLSLMEMLPHGRPLMAVEPGRLRRSLRLLFGFLVGCVVAATAIPLLGDWAWSCPVALGGIAIWLR